MQINKTCNACPLHKSAKSICLQGLRVESPRPLMIYAPHPDYFSDNAKRAFANDSGRFLDWVLARLSIPVDSVAYDYVLRCYPRGKLPTTKAGRAEYALECNHYRFANIAKVKPRAIVTVGGAAFELFTGKGSTLLKEHLERPVPAWENVVKRYSPNIFPAYSLEMILLKSPSDCVSLVRTVYNAAIEAGLKPRFNPVIKPFSWPIL